jgi:hypothetical protein
MPGTVQGGISVNSECFVPAHLSLDELSQVRHELLEARVGCQQGRKRRAAGGVMVAVTARSHFRAHLEQYE